MGLYGYACVTAAELPAPVDFRFVELQHFDPESSWDNRSPWVVTYDDDGKNPQVKPTFVLVKEFYTFARNERIHRWMEVLYNQKGGKGDNDDGLFNWVPVQLVENDIERLYKDISENNMELPMYSSRPVKEYTEEMKVNDLGFVFAARSKLKWDLNIFYYGSF